MKVYSSSVEKVYNNIASVSVLAYYPCAFEVFSFITG